MGMVCPDCYFEKYGKLYTVAPDDSPGSCVRHLMTDKKIVLGGIMKKTYVAGLNLYRANYKFASLADESTELVVAPDIEAVVSEIGGNPSCRITSIDLIEEDVSMVILETEK